MAVRIASAVVGLPLLIMIVWAGLPWFSALAAAAAGIAALELCHMARRWGGRPFTPIAVASAIALVAGGHFLADAPSVWTRAAPGVGVVACMALAWLLWSPRAGTGLPALGVTAGAALYAGGFLFHAPLLRALDQGREWVLLMLLVTFATDTCAFFVGRAIGRRPLAPGISPSKTVEGALGGVAGAVGAGVGAVLLLDMSAGLARALALGAVMGIVGQLGDLAESRLKRLAEIKDSGWLVPGHGGILDRLDSIVLNLLVVYYFGP